MRRDRLPPAPFARALRGASVAVIAELKRRSPSKGDINPAMSVVDRAGAYERGGACALSVLTEPTEFGGSADDLSVVATVSRLPVLKKDFHVDPIQLLQAAALGASAALLIARALPPSALDEMVGAAHELAVDVLLEVRTEDELSRALSFEHVVIGINNRDLETLVVDAVAGRRLVSLVPPGRAVVAESGITGRQDVEAAAAAGADAVLVGSTVSAAADPEEAVRSLTGVPRDRTR
jgi:indole-3-glycerol phosphate synthase